MLGSMCLFSLSIIEVKNVFVDMWQDKCIEIGYFICNGCLRGGYFSVGYLGSFNVKDCLHWISGLMV